jgi:hypothetical protein
MIIAWCFGASSIGGDRPPSLDWIIYITDYQIVKKKMEKVW